MPSVSMPCRVRSFASSSQISASFPPRLERPPVARWVNQVTDSKVRLVFRIHRDPFREVQFRFGAFFVLLIQCEQPGGEFLCRAVRIDHRLKCEFALVVFSTEVKNTSYARFFSSVGFRIRTIATLATAFFTPIVAALTCGGWVCGSRFGFGFCGFGFCSACLFMRNNGFQSFLCPIFVDCTGAEFWQVRLPRDAVKVLLGPYRVFPLQFFLWGEAQVCQSVALRKWVIKYQIG